MYGEFIKMDTVSRLFLLKQKFNPFHTPAVGGEQVHELKMKWVVLPRENIFIYIHILDYLIILGLPEFIIV